MSEIYIDSGPENDREDWQKRPTIAKYPHATQIMKLFPNFVPSWRMYKQFCVASENLFQERGEGNCKEALDYYKKHKDEPFIPSIYTPIDLDSKWDKLVAYSLKHQ